MSALRTHPARGQAAVELALTLLVFVTVVAFGIHFAEVGYLSTRVQHAGAFALYDATGGRTHEATGNASNPFTYYSGTPGLATSKAHKYFKDFEANTGGDHATAPITHVFTKIDGMRVRCTAESSIEYNPSGGVPSPFDGSVGGMKCTAEAEVELFNFPEKFFEGEWNLKEKHYAAAKKKYKVCLTPRSPDGNCGEIGILTNDFSLQGPRESRSHDTFSGGNDYYSAVVQKAWGFSSCPASIGLSLWSAVFARPDACFFQFGYQGVENDYLQKNVTSHAGGSTTWLTGGTADKRTANINNGAFLVRKR